MSDGFADSLADVDRAALLASGQLRTYARGAPLFHEGDTSDEVTVIIEGRVKIVVHGHDGTETLLSVRGPGAIVGELAGIDDSPRLASAFALEPVTARVMAATEFRAFVEDHPGAAVALLRVLVGRLRETDRRRAEFGALDATRRLAQLLADLSTEDAGGAPLAARARGHDQRVAGVGGARAHRAPGRRRGVDQPPTRHRARRRPAPRRSR